MITLQIPNIGGGENIWNFRNNLGERKKEMLQYIQERVQEKIDGWQTKFPTTAGKETLIKDVAYAMPLYSMNCFQFPIELCSEIDSMIARFWWARPRINENIMGSLEQDGNTLKD